MLGEFRARLEVYTDRLRSSYWFLPLMMLVMSALVAAALVSLDRRLDAAAVRGMPAVFGGGAEGARLILSTIAGSVIAAASTTFSITIAVLSFTSSQFGPRLLRGFLRDTGNQLVLGTFVSTFLYCLLVLNTVRGPEEIAFTPHVAVAGAVFFAVASVGMLVFFIHRISTSIQASQVISNVAGELHRAIERLYPEAIGKEEQVPEPSPPYRQDQCGEIRSEGSGYLQLVEGERLLALAAREEIVITLSCTPGDYIAHDARLGYFAPKGERNDEVEKSARGAFLLGDERTEAQDCEFLLLQLVEIAVRALSPGTNDPITARMCIDRLGDALFRLVGRRFPATRRADDEGHLRLIMRTKSFEDLLRVCFVEIIHYGKADPHIAESLKLVLERLSAEAPNPAHRAAARELIAQVENDS